MSMPILEKLQSDVHRYDSTFTAARARIAALAAYPTLDALVAELLPGARTLLAQDEERAALLSALVVEAQRSRHPLWPSLLAVAYAPMLRRIRRQTIACRGDTPEDLDQRVLSGFLEAVQKASPEFVTQGLRWKTQSSAWAAGEDEVREERIQEDDERVWFDGDSFELQEIDESRIERCENPFAEEDAMHERIAARRIARELEDKRQHELLGALVASGDRGDDLRAFVNRRFADRPALEREREYQRLRTEQKRAVGRLRARHGRDAA
jgi:hypothetical protein